MGVKNDEIKKSCGQYNKTHVRGRNLFLKFLRQAGNGV